MSWRSVRLIKEIDSLKEDDTMAVAAAVMGYLSIGQIIALILATLDTEGKAELEALLAAIRKTELVE
jgi:hypothetical protein